MGRRQKFNPRVGDVKVEYSNDDKLLSQLLRIVLFAIQLADMPDEEAEAAQRKFLDSFGRV